MEKVVIPVMETELKTRLVQGYGWSSIVDTALNIAKSSHERQLTKDGTPYLTNHLFPVVNELLNHYEGNMLENAVAIALLHDVLEDDSTMTVDVLSSHLPLKIVKSVSVLSRQSESRGAGELTKLQLSRVYMQEISRADYEVRIVKLADRIINLELVQRLRESYPGKFKAYIEETRELFVPLAKLTSRSCERRLNDKLQVLGSL